MMKRFLLVVAILLTGIDCFAQLHLEDGVVYCDDDYLIIGRIQANFIDDMAVCQYPEGYAFMLLEGDKVLVTVNLGEDRDQAIGGMRDFIELAMTKSSKRSEFHLKDISGKDVQMLVYPENTDALKTKVRLFCPSENMGSGIVLLNNLYYFPKVLEKYPGVQFRNSSQTATETITTPTL